MSNHKIDQLFKNKIEGYTTKPSPEAWMKLDAQLNPGNKKGIIWWSSIAASVAIVIAITLWTINTTENGQDNNAVALQDNTATTPESQNNDTNDSDQQPISEQLENTPIAVIEQVEETINKEATTSNREANYIVPPKNKEEIVNEQVEKLVPEINDSENEEDVENTEEIINNITPVNSDELLAVNDGPEQLQEVKGKSDERIRGSVKIIYTLQPVVKTDSSVLKPKKKNSPFNKMVAFAKNITESENGIGNLREAKDNLLSFKKN